jgi:formate hydrogenlyase transcriptional activator
MIERLGARAGFIAIPSATQKGLQIVAREGMTARDAHAIEAWYAKRLDQTRSPLVMSEIENNAALADLRGRLALPSGTLLFQDLGFDQERLGLMCVHKTSESSRTTVSQDDLHFVAAYSSLISLSVYELVRTEKKGKAARPARSAGRGFESIVTENRDMIHLLNLAERVAHSDATVLLQGETGTGKGLIAYAIHLLSERRDRPFVHVNCAALPEQLLESELFGHVRGAFTNAYFDKNGLLIEANGGTIFLDEIGELNLETQVKLLRVLQEQEFEPVGSSRTLSVDVRVIASTNRNLREAVEAGRFRADLFYRLNVFPIEIPPLRERRSDIPKLVAFSLSRLSKRFGKKIEGVSRESMEHILDYPWPGNIRELQNVIERAVIVSAEPILRLDRDLTPVTGAKAAEIHDAHGPEGRAIVPESAAELPSLKELERNHILAALHKTGGKIEGSNGAAKILDLHPNTLRHRIQKLGIRTTPSRPS